MPCFTQHDVVLKTCSEPLFKDKEHLTKTAEKLQHCCLVSERATTAWGDNANTLHMSALALCYLCTVRQHGGDPTTHHLSSLTSTTTCL